MGRFLFPARIRSDDASVETLYYFILLQWGHAEQDNNSISEDHNKRTLRHTKGQGSCRQNIGTFESYGIDAIA